MRFSVRENRAPLAVLTVRDGSVVSVPRSNGDRARRVVANWLRERYRRFGLAPAINLVLIVAVVGLLTCFDAARWNSGPTLDLVRRHPFRRLIYFNLFWAVGVFVVLAESETGPFRWDGLFGAAVVAVGYQGLLKTTILETPSGQKIGLSGVYEGWLRRTNEAVMVLRSGMTNEKVDFIAHTNSLPRLRTTLRTIYWYARTPERRQALVSALDAEVEAAPSRIEQKRVCARKLLALMSWHQLQEHRLVPREIEERDLIGPGPILAEGQRHVLADASRSRRAETLLEACFEEMARHSPEDAEREKEAMLERIREVSSDRGGVYEMLEFLFARWNYDLDRIEGEDLVDRCFRERELESRRELRGKRWWWRRADVREGESAEPSSGSDGGLRSG